MELFPGDLSVVSFPVDFRVASKAEFTVESSVDLRVGVDVSEDNDEIEDLLLLDNEDEDGEIDRMELRDLGDDFAGVVSLEDLLDLGVDGAEEPFGAAASSSDESSKMFSGGTEPIWLKSSILSLSSTKTAGPPGARAKTNCAHRKQWSYI